LLDLRETRNRGPASAQQRYALQRVRDTRFHLAVNDHFLFNQCCAARWLGFFRRAPGLTLLSVSPHET
jgi:hypothetical protein